MVRIISPVPAASPALDIKLNQNPNQFFFPATNISGSVIYTNHHGDKNYDLRLIFGGLNKITLIKGSKRTSESATLFEYTEHLHIARKGSHHKLENGQIDTAPYLFSFKHRFPSATDNRSFNVPHASGWSNTTFSNHVHDLPPSFQARSISFECSVEYSIRAELYFEKSLSASCTVPIMFIPYMRSVHRTRNSPKLFSVHDVYRESSICKTRKDSLVDHYPNTMLNVTTEMPTEIPLGGPFEFDVVLNLSARLELDDGVPSIQVLYLTMVSSANCRALQPCPPAPPSQIHDHEWVKEKTITLHPSACPRLPVLSSTGTELVYSFEATLSSYCSPTFRSFLVSNTFRFEGLLIVVDGRKIELAVSTTEVVVLSPVAQPSGVRRVPAMANARAGSVVYGRG